MSSTHNFRKHTHKNPIEKLLLRFFYHKLLQELRNIHPVRILDAGAGEGFTIDRLQKEQIGKEIEGVEFMQEAIDLGKQHHPNAHIIQGDIHKLPYPDNSFDTVICTEVLEHVVEPEKALQELVRVSSKYVVLTVPSEPFFMAGNFVRGKNLSRLGNDIEHINHWTFFGFRNMVSEYAKIKTHFPLIFWTLIVAEKK